MEPKLTSIDYCIWSLQDSWKQFKISTLLDRYKRPKITIDSLLTNHIMFCNSLDLRVIRMYLTMDYILIFKYNYGFLKLSSCDYSGVNECIQSTDRQQFISSLPHLKVCTKQDIKNYCYWTNNYFRMLYPPNIKSCWISYNDPILIKIIKIWVK